jgi:predicted nucleotidyltransferase
MHLTAEEKDTIKRDVVASLKDEPEVRRIVIFGSFVRSDDPNDMDVAVFQDSAETYLPLAVKYRMKLDRVSERIPLDVLPIRPNPRTTLFLREIEKGEVIYERRDP